MASTSKMVVSKKPFSILLGYVFAACFLLSRSQATVLKTGPSLDIARTNANADVGRSGVIDVVDGVPHFQLASLLFVSAFGSEGREPADYGSFQSIAAILLANEHLNTGNGTIVPEVSGLNERCPLRFTLENFDTAGSEIEAVEILIDVLGRENNPDEGPVPAAIIGAMRSAVSVPTSIIAGLKGFPMVSALSTSTQLDDKSQFPLFGRSIPTDAGTATPIIKYLRYQLGVKHLAVLHVNDSYGNAYAVAMQVAAARDAPDMVIQSFDIPLDPSPEIVERTVEFLRRTEYRYFFGILFNNQYGPIMTEAYNQGIAGTGKHNWVFTDSTSSTVIAAEREAGSPLELASRGAMRIAAVGGVAGIPRYDKFLASMLDLDNAIDSEYIQSKHPIYPKEPDYVPFQVSTYENFFDASVHTMVPFAYDAAIALGLAACGAVAPPEEDFYLSGVDLFQAFKQADFEGASGRNVYDVVTGTRDPDSARFLLANAVEDSNVDGIVRMNMVNTDLFQNGEWESITPLILNDGTSRPPPDLPEFELDNNYIGLGLRFVALLMAAIVMVVSCGFAVIVHLKAGTRVVKASQPFFLNTILAGCFLMGMSIVFRSFDDETLAPKTCSAFCIAFPWFLSFGWILAFSALFAKTNRVNRLFRNPTFRRLKVTITDVLKPIIALLILATFVLTLWVVLAPAEWVREVVEVDIFNRVVETQGSCDYSDGTPYIVILSVMLLAVLIYTIYEAYSARKVSTEFVESEYIALVLVAMMLISFLGIPVLVIASNEPRTEVFVQAGMIFVVCMAILLLMFVPKFLAIKNEKNKRPRLSTRRSGGSKDNYMGGGTMISGIKFSDAELNADLNGTASFVIEGTSELDLDVDYEEDESGSLAEGMAITNYPKQIEELQEKNRQLESTVKTLTNMNKKMKNFARKQQISNMAEADEPHKTIRFEEDEEKGSKAFVKEEKKEDEEEEELPSAAFTSLSASNNGSNGSNDTINDLKELNC